MGQRLCAIVVSFNQGRFLAEALMSVLEQGDCVSEVVLVDDGSDDDTLAVAEGFRKVVRILHTAHRGAAAARNLGWRATRAELVAFLDADDVWSPDKLKRQLRELEAHPNAGLVYTDTLRVKPDRTPIDPWSAHFPPVVGDAFLPMLRENRVQTSTVVIRRSLLEELGGFDESLEAWEDVDLWVRAAEGYEFAYVHDVLACYRMNRNGLSSRAMAMAVGRLESVKKVIRDAKPGRLSHRQGRALLADAYGHVGVACYLDSDMASARRWVWRSWEIDPGSLLRNRFVWTFAKSLIGPRIVGSLRKRLRPAA